ncbi:MAG: hypothetical protein QOI85_855 [Chloroflexota bacterium]|jgi:hypothetical protein|nr:hypothetical protein [Chloroflexota bacterium]
MTTVEIPAAAESPQDVRARHPSRWWLVLVVALAGALTIWLAFQSWLVAVAPVAHGSMSVVLGDTRPCVEPYGDDTVTCYEATFAEGAPVGVGITIRNDGPIPMTILAITSFGRNVRTTATLDPELLADGSTFGIGAGRPFEPITIDPAAEVPVQLVGTFVSCQEAAAHYMPGSAIIVTQLDLTVRWLYTQQQIVLPLREVLALDAPEAGACG